MRSKDSKPFANGIPRIFGLKIEVVHGAGQVFRGFQLGLHEGLVDYDLCRHISKFTSLPRLHLFPHGVKVPLHPIPADRNAVRSTKMTLSVWRERA